ncbi:GTP-binding protein Rho1 [Saitozyma podzolica]|uniref:GTP-binding protein Rho1 n=1 Tax=Saitozyma podzolica TaxID=1890683 RepID=A0A427YSR4_9TREE|nr:GTP-binding protein Rho1 [Saitozyma podzolica]
MASRTPTPPPGFSAEASLHLRLRLLAEALSLLVFSKGMFPEVYIPTVFETHVADVEVNGKKVELSLWDTAGHEDYNRLRPLSYPGSHVVLICFAIDLRSSLDNVREKWVTEVLHFCKGRPIILVACKKDLRDDPKTIQDPAWMNQGPVTRAEGIAVAQEIRARDYVECSTKTGEGVREVFQTAARHALMTLVPDLGAGDGDQGLSDDALGSLMSGKAPEPCLEADLGGVQRHLPPRSYLWLEAARSGPQQTEGEPPAKEATATDSVFKGINVQSLLRFSSTNESGAVLLTKATCWSAKEDLLVVFNATYTPVGEVGPTADWHIAASDSGWLMSRITGPSDRRVVFFGGIVFRYRKLAPSSAALGQRKFNSPGTTISSMLEDPQDQQSKVEVDMTEFGQEPIQPSKNDNEKEDLGTDDQRQVDSLDFDVDPATQRIPVPGTGPTPFGVNFHPRDLCVLLSQREKGYDCFFSGRLVGQVRLNISLAQFQNYITNTWRKVLQMVNYDTRTALQTLAEAGALLFSNLFERISFRSDDQDLGKLLREILGNGTDCQLLQCATDNVPVRWAMLYLGDVSPGVTLDARPGTLPRHATSHRAIPHKHDRLRLHYHLLHHSSPTR